MALSKQQPLPSTFDDGSAHLRAANAIDAPQVIACTTTASPGRGTGYLLGKPRGGTGQHPAAGAVLAVAALPAAGPLQGLRVSAGGAH